jgi:hypothetical protein
MPTICADTCIPYRRKTTASHACWRALDMMSLKYLAIPFNAQCTANLGADLPSLTILTPCVPFLFLVHYLYWPMEYKFMLALAKAHAQSNFDSSVGASVGYVRLLRMLWHTHLARCPQYWKGCNWEPFVVSVLNRTWSMLETDSPVHLPTHLVWIITFTHTLIVLVRIVMHFSFT